MKKLLFVLLAAAVLGTLGLLPFRAVDAAKLLPVKTIIVTKSGEEYTVDIGAGVRAVGRSLREALDRLREEVTGEVFLPTAEQVVITEPGDEAVEAVAEESEFRPAAGIYRTPEPFPDAKALGAYLESHPSNVTILDVRAALALGQRPRVPVIRAADGGFRVDDE
ncbi:MAG: hypothetical protein IKS05_03410 [Oscillospiraceae bacterium]|nr:hypothetical protein [Oscillospiraceae bacterium]